jgi:hypothetical protein
MEQSPIFWDIEIMIPPEPSVGLKLNYSTEKNQNLVFTAKKSV